MLAGRLLRSFHRSLVLRRLETCTVPQIGEGLAKLTITRWLVKEGEPVAELQEICEAEGDKGTTNLFSKYTGVLKKVFVAEGTDGNVGSPLYQVDIPDGSAAPFSPPQPVTAPVSETRDKTEQKLTVAHSAEILALPATRRLAKELGVDLATVKGTGRRGTILKEDVMKLSAPKSQVTPARPAATTVSAAPTLKKMPKIMRSMAKSMTESLKIPHLTLTDDVRMDNLIALRKQLNDLLPKDKKLTYMPFFMKALSIAMSEYPIVNSRLLENLEEYEEFPHHNISVAIDTPYGLIVPNIKNCERKSLVEMQSELRRLQELGKENKMPLDDVLGGTISLSNVGSIGGIHGIPVIFPPQVFIGGIGGMRPMLRKSKNGDILESQVIGVSWSADHRLVDGATTARFGQRWKQIIENPTLLMLSLR